jgi:hypothetical protein
MDELDFRRFLVARYRRVRMVSGPFGRLIQIGTLSPLAIGRSTTTRWDSQ